MSKEIKKKRFNRNILNLQIKIPISNETSATILNNQNNNIPTINNPTNQNTNKQIYNSLDITKYWQNIFKIPVKYDNNIYDNILLTINKYYQSHQKDNILILTQSIPLEILHNEEDYNDFVLGRFINESNKGQVVNGWSSHTLFNNYNNGINNVRFYIITKDMKLNSDHYIHKYNQDTIRIMQGKKLLLFMVGHCYKYSLDDAGVEEHNDYIYNLKKGQHSYIYGSVNKINSEDICNFLLSLNL